MRINPTQRALKLREALRTILNLVGPDPENYDGFTVQRGPEFDEAVRAANEAMHLTRCIVCRDQGHPDGCHECGAKP